MYLHEIKIAYRKTTSNTDHLCNDWVENTKHIREIVGD